MPTGDPDFIRADPWLRRNALLIFGSAVVIGVALIGWGLPALQNVLLDARSTGQISGRAICIGFVAFVSLLAAPVTYTGLRIVRESGLVIATAQFPAPGDRVIRDTRILRGPRAIVIGRVQRVLGALLVTCAIALVALCAYAAFVLLR